MKFFLLALFVAAVAAKPAPLDEDNQAVEVIVNGLPEGQALELGGIVDLKLKEHVNGELAASSDLLHPYTAVGLAQAAAAAEALKPENNIDNSILIVAPGVSEVESPIPSPVVMPPPIAPEVAEEDSPIPSPVVMPPPVAPEVAVEDSPIPSPVVMPPPVAPEVAEEDSPIPSPVVMPPPVAPEVAEVDSPIPSPVVMPPPVAPEVSEDVPAVIPEPAAQLPFGEIYNDGLVTVQVNAPQDAGVFATLQSWFNMAVNYFSNGVQTSSQQIV